MFPDYTLKVLGEYKNRLATNSLSPRLSRPTPAKLKEECADICRERFSRKDDKTLKIFFGQSGDAAIHLQAIAKFDADKFKPLIKYLRGQTNKTEDKNIELLAWLLDFQPRPYEHKMNYLQGDEASVATDNRKSKDEKDDLGRNSTEKPPTIDKDNFAFGSSKPAIYPSFRRWLKKKNVIIAVAIILILGVGGYQLYNIASASRLTGHESCMYWAGDHYESVSCSKKMNDIVAIALDSVRMKNFKRITKPDTITQYSVGRIWYIKINNKLEFYTAGGNHPVNMQLQLKPLTSYIINRYLQIPNQ